MSWHSEVLAFVGIFVLLLDVVLFSNGKSFRDIKIPTIIWPFFALLLILSLQAIGGQINFLGDVIVIAIYLIGVICCLVLGFNLSEQTTDQHSKDRGTEFLQILAIGSLFAALLSTAMCLAQALSVWDSQIWLLTPLYVSRPGANLGQPNHLATLLTMGLASLVFLQTRGRLSRSLATFVATVLLLGIAATGSRSGVLIVAGLGLWLGYSQYIQKMKKPWLIPVAASTALWCMMVLWPKIVWAVQEGAWGASSGREYFNAAASVRLIVWEQLIGAATQRPWLGWGLREVSAAHNAVAHKFEISEPYTYAHNMLLDLVLGVGFPLAATFIGIVVWWLVRRIRSTKTVQAHYCLALLFALLIHSQVEYPYAYAYFLFPVCIAIGILEGSIADCRSHRISKKKFAALALLYTSVSVWSAVEYVGLEEDFRIARFEALRIGITPPEYRAPKTLLLTQLSEMVWASRVTPRTNMTELEITRLRKVAQRFPWTAVQNRYALALAMNGRTSEAVRQLLVMRSLHGEKHYQQLKVVWKNLIIEKYPQLTDFPMP